LRDHRGGRSLLRLASSGARASALISAPCTSLPPFASSWRGIGGSLGSARNGEGFDHGFSRRRWRNGRGGSNRLGWRGLDHRFDNFPHRFLSHHTRLFGCFWRCFFSRFLGKCGFRGDLFFGCSSFGCPWFAGSGGSSGGFPSNRFFGSFLLREQRRGISRFSHNKTLKIGCGRNSCVRLRSMSR